MLRVPKCAHCGGPMEQPGLGRRRRYCSAACRQAALRTRRSAAQWLPAISADAIQLPQSIPTDEQVARLILEVRALAGAASRLAGEARPALAWRCERLSQALRAALDEHFDGVDR